jgi:hypothetical protein
MRSAVKTGVINIPQRFLITKWGEDIGIINKSYDVGDLYPEAGVEFSRL